MATVRTGLAGTPDLGRPEQPELGRSQPPTICRVVAVESISTRFTFLFRSPFVSLLLRCSFVPCEFLQCTVLGKHGAVSDDVTLRGRDVIFFLKQAKIILRCRYAPGMPRPGVSK